MRLWNTTKFSAMTFYAALCFGLFLRQSISMHQLSVSCYHDNMRVTEGISTKLDTSMDCTFTNMNWFDFWVQQGMFKGHLPFENHFASHDSN